MVAAIQYAVDRSLCVPGKEVIVMTSTLATGGTNGWWFTCLHFEGVTIYVSAASVWPIRTL